MSDETLKKYATKFGFEIEADTEYKHVPFASYILKSFPTESFVFKDEVLSLDVYKKNPIIRNAILWAIWNRSKKGGIFVVSRRGSRTRCSICANSNKNSQ